MYEHVICTYDSQDQRSITWPLHTLLFSLGKLLIPKAIFSCLYVVNPRKGKTFYGN